MIEMYHGMFPLEKRELEATIVSDSKTFNI